MSRKQNWYIGRYVRAVSGFLPCSGKVKKPLLDTLRAQAEEYIADGGDAAALEQRFGTPQQADVHALPLAGYAARIDCRQQTDG